MSDLVGNPEDRFSHVAAHFNNSFSNNPYYEYCDAYFIGTVTSCCLTVGYLLIALR